MSAVEGELIEAPRGVPKDALPNGSSLDWPCSKETLIKLLRRPDIEIRCSTVFGLPVVYIEGLGIGSDAKDVTSRTPQLGRRR